MSGIEDIRALASYYKDILAHLSERTAQHLWDTTRILRHGLIADLSPFIVKPSVLLDDDEIVFRVERSSPECASRIVEDAAKEEDEAGSDTEPTRPVDPALFQRQEATARLVAMYRKQEIDPFNRETIVGWPFVSGNPAGAQFCAPLLYFPVRVEYDPVGSSVALSLQVDAPVLNSYLVSKLVPSHEEAHAVRTKLLPYLHAPGFDLKALQDVASILAEMVPAFRGLVRDARHVAPFASALEQREARSAVLLNCIVAINAARANAFLQDDLAEIARLEEVASGTVVDTIMAHPDSGGPSSWSDAIEDEETLGKVLFPLRSNRAQRLVGATAERARLLVVEGPPGTGKSQTIANLVCHLVGKGHTVLVTSHQNKALEVVARMLPEIEFLAMSLLKGERESVIQLQNLLEHFSADVDGRSLKDLRASLEVSFSDISSQNLSAARLKARFSELKRLEREREAPYRRYRDIRSYDVIDPQDTIEPGKESILCSALRDWAACLTQLRPTQEGLQALFQECDEGALPSLMMDLCELTRNAKEALVVMRQQETASIVRDLVEMSAGDPAAKDVFLSWSRWLTEQGDKLAAASVEVAANYGRATPLPTAIAAATALGPDAAVAIHSRSVETKEKAVALLARWPGGGGQRPFPDSATLERVASLRTAVRADSASWLRWHFAPGARAARRELCRCAGLPRFAYAQRERVLAELDQWVSLWTSHRGVVDSLGDFASCGLEFQAPPARPSAPMLTRCAVEAEAVARLVALLSSAPAAHPNTRSGIFHELCNSTDRGSTARTSTVFAEAAAQLELSGIIERLRKGPVGANLSALVPALMRAISVFETFGSCDTELLRIETLVAAFPLLKRLSSLEDGVLTPLGRTLKVARKQILRGEDLEWLRQPELALEAYRLARLIRVDGVENPDDISDVAASIRKVDEAKRDAILRAVNSARKVSRKEAAEDQKTRYQISLMRRLLSKKTKTQSLVSLRGQTDYARLLKVFPCWIAGIEDVARIFPLEPALFDYLIVDEASQCNQATTLHLAYRARRMCVFGDEHQLKNPQVRFLSDTLVQQLLAMRRLHLHPKAPFLNARQSLLSLAEASADKQVMLNEHFRCEPPLIDWSNRRYYHGRLRIMTPIRARRFVPVGEVRLVSGADDDPEEKRNRTEADAVVAEAARLIDSGEAKGLTIGILSPFTEQATLLLNTLHERFAERPHLIKSHQMVASTADGFQGDERDIILFSFRCGPSTPPGAVRAIEIEEERLNVAFSRARRKVICFVSIPPQEFPGRLIRDFLVHIQEVQKLASGRLSDVGDKFDSKFEADVCGMLRARGVSVLTQVPCGGFRIDLVALDAENRRLAIECDGDFHYEEDGDLRPEDWQRQDIIERSGWTVHRIPSRRFYLSPVAAIDSVVAELRSQPSEIDLDAGESVSEAEIEEQEESFRDRLQPELEETAESTRPPPAVVAVVPGQRLESGTAPPGHGIASAPPPTRSTGSMPPVSRHVTEPLRFPLEQQMDPNCWYRLSHWGRVTGRLNPYANRFCFDIGRRLRSPESKLTEKQVQFGQRVWRAATAQGFDPTMKHDAS